MSKVKGNKNGLVLSNNIAGKKSEPLITVAQLKATWLFGVKIRDKETGQDMSDDAYQNAIDTAISLLEHYLDISVTPVRNFVQYKDYNINDYYEWGYMQLDNYPVECINSIRLVYFRDDNGNVDENQVTTIPNRWIRLDNHDGIIRLVPSGPFPANLQVGNGGFYPEIMRHQKIPHAWEINYNYGFCSGQVPVLLNQAISMVAAIIMLITAGHLILGAGIAGTSISLDGLSQSIQTTQSAENSGFSSTIKDISDKLYGKTKDDPFAIMTILKNYYKGATMTIL
jgi:hypothetical protein